MKTVFILAATVTVGSAFLAAPTAPTTTARHQSGCLLATLSDDTTDDSGTSRKSFLTQASAATALAGSTLLWTAAVPSPVQARGRATLERSYERYAPRIRAGTEFYGSDLRSLVAKNDWAGIKNALQEPPKREKGDLQKPDAGVAERARQAGGFSDARVLVAADLFAGAFSDSSISPKTRKMQASVEKLRDIVQEMQKTALIALGEETTGGFFGIGAKKPPEAELVKNLRELYVTGGNVWNEYIYAANEDLALQFDRFQYVQ